MDVNQVQKLKQFREFAISRGYKDVGKLDKFIADQQASFLKQAEQESQIGQIAMRIVTGKLSKLF